jgi:hypothetical protein
MTPAYDTGHRRSRPRLTRRDVLRATHTAAVGLGGILLTRTPPAMAQERELKLLTWSHFVPHWQKTQSQRPSGRYPAGPCL